MCKALWPPCVLVSQRFASPFVARKLRCADRRFVMRVGPLASPIRGAQRPVRIADPRRAAAPVRLADPPRTGPPLASRIRRAERPPLASPIRGAHRAAARLSTLDAQTARCLARIAFRAGAYRPPQG